VPRSIDDPDVLDCTGMDGMMIFDQDMVPPSINICSGGVWRPLADRIWSRNSTTNVVTLRSPWDLVGIGAIPMNKLDVEGGAVIGATYSGTNTAPANGLLVEGNVGIGTTTTAQRLNVGGNIDTTGDITVNGGDVDMIKGMGSSIHSLGQISFDWTAAGTYDNPANHGIQSRNEAGAWGDELRINSYNDLILTLDSNDSDGASSFKIQEHSTADGIDLFEVRSPSGQVAMQGPVFVNTTASNAQLNVAGSIYMRGGDFLLDNATGTEPGPIKVVYNSGSYWASYAPSLTAGAVCFLPWGGTIASGSSVTAYQSPSVPSGNPCISEVRTCTNGILSGTYTNQACVVGSSVCTPSCEPCTYDSVCDEIGSQLCKAADCSESYQSCGARATDGVSCGSAYCVNDVAHSPRCLSGACQDNTQTCAYWCLGGTCMPECRNWRCHHGIWADVGACSSPCSAQAYLREYCEEYVCVYDDPAAPCENVCTTPTVSCDLPWGGTIGEGNQVYAYQSPDVFCGMTCTGEWRTCLSSGTLTGTYLYEDCFEECVSVYSCTGAIPLNATMCTGDATGLTADTPNTVCGDNDLCCGSPKCEYYCNWGYIVVGPQCEKTCFIAGTAISMADGTTKPIEKVVKDDVILGSDGTNKVQEAIILPHEGWLYSLNGGKHFVTESHPFMTQEGVWKAFNPEAAKKENPDLVIEELKVGDVLVTRDGTIEVGKVDRVWKQETVYNIVVDNTHDYYADGYLVHNKMACDEVNKCPLGQECITGICYPHECGYCCLYSDWVDACVRDYAGACGSVVGPCAL
jgi:hypothetical protein